MKKSDEELDAKAALRRANKEKRKGRPIAGRTTGIVIVSWLDEDDCYRWQLVDADHHVLLEGEPFAGSDYDFPRHLQRIALDLTEVLMEGLIEEAEPDVLAGSEG